MNKEVLCLLKQHSQDMSLKAAFAEGCVTICVNRKARGSPCLCVWTAAGRGRSRHGARRRAKTQMGTEGRETFPEHLSALFEIVTQHVLGRHGDGMTTASTFARESPFLPS